MKALTLFLFVTAFLPADDFKLPAGCTLPFASIAPTSDPAGSCPNEGSGTNLAPIKDAAKVREDLAKNTFCADFSQPVPVDFKILRDMQAKAPAKSKLVSSRAALQKFFPVGDQKIGEGTVVQIVAFMKDAHVSDCREGSAGEDVNCKVLGVDKNDFHIPLLDPTQPKPTSQVECTSVTAEISPHFRPAAWAGIDLQTPTGNPVRITGPLFFDDSHEICKMVGGKLQGPGPQRSSLWEVHPVYQVEVCASTDPAKCSIHATGATWTPYDQWIKTHASQTTASGKAAHEACVSAARK